MGRLCRPLHSGVAHYETVSRGTAVVEDGLAGAPGVEWRRVYADGRGGSDAGRRRLPVDCLMEQGQLFALNDTPGLRDDLKRGQPPVCIPLAISSHTPPRHLSALSKVRELMLDGEWRTLSEIAEAVGHMEAGCSARLRDLRKAGYTVERRPRGGSGLLYEYQVTKYFSHEE